MSDLPSPSAPPLRILQLNTMLKGGGTDDQCAKLTLGLLQCGQHVAIAGPDGRDFSPTLRALKLPFHPTPPEGPLKLRFIAHAARLIRRERIQIVHGHHGRDIWPTILAARLSGARPKVVISRHLAKSPGSAFSRAFMLSRCDALVAVSHFTARVLRAGVDDPASLEVERHSRPPLRGDFRKLHVIYGGIDTDRFRPLETEASRAELGLQPGDYAFGVVGGYGLPRGKGQREFLAAAAQIKERVPQARFLIIGRGNMETILKQDIARLGLTGKAWLTRYFSEMPPVMNALDCLVHPQIGTEAFGLVVCEAHACGRPVIASDLDGIPEAFATGSYGQLVPPESIDALAEAMAHWAQRPALTLDERQALHRRIHAEYSVPAFGRRMLELYRQLLS